MLRGQGQLINVGGESGDKTGDRVSRVRVVWAGWENNCSQGANTIMLALALRKES